MIIACTFENEKIGQHFGHTEFFKIYSVREGIIEKSGVINTQGNGHGALVGFLTGIGVDVLICGGIGPGAIEGLKSAGIQVYAGNMGDPDIAVESLIAGTLAQNQDANCNHHGGEHNCATHKDNNCATHKCH